MEPDHIHPLRMDYSAKFSIKPKLILLQLRIFELLPTHIESSSENMDILFALAEINISGKILLMQSVVFSYSIIRTNLAS